MTPAAASSAPAATTWVLLRGLTRETGHWGAFPDRLGTATGRRVVCLDLPGNGVLFRQRSLPTVEAMADFCHGELARRRLGGPVEVLAMSLGAMVATAWALRHPADLAGAVLINTSMRPFSPFYHRLRPANYPRLLGLFGGATSERIEQTVMELTSVLARDGARRGAVLHSWLACRERRPVSTANALRQLLAAARFRAPPRPPPLRLRLLAAQGDRLVDPRCSRRLAAAWKLPLAMHASAGHDLPLDDPDWVIAHAQEFACDRRIASAEFSPGHAVR